MNERASKSSDFERQRASGMVDFQASRDPHAVGWTTDGKPEKLRRGQEGLLPLLVSQDLQASNWNNAGIITSISSPTGSNHMQTV